MHAHVSGLANQASVVPKHDELCFCIHAQGTEEGSRQRIVCGSPRVLLCRTVTASALCQVCLASSDVSARRLRVRYRYWESVRCVGPAGNSCCTGGLFVCLFINLNLILPPSLGSK